MKRIALAIALSVCVITPAMSDTAMQPAQVAAPAIGIQNPGTVVVLTLLVLLAFAGANA